MIYSIQTPKGGDPWENLASAIIVQAANDYLRMRDKETLKWFFRSQWYRELTDVDGEYLINTLDGYTEAERDRKARIKAAKRLRADGYKVKDIARKLGIHYETARAYLKR